MIKREHRGFLLSKRVSSDEGGRGDEHSRAESLSSAFGDDVDFHFSMLQSPIKEIATIKDNYQS